MHLCVILFFVEDILLCFQTKKKILWFHSNITIHIFLSWLVSVDWPSSGLPYNTQIKVYVLKECSRSIGSHKLIKLIENLCSFNIFLSFMRIIVPVYNKGDYIECSNYRGIPLFPTTYKIVFNILLSILNPYAEAIIDDQQCEFRRNRITTDHILFTRKILEKIMGIKWSSTSALHRLQERLWFG